MVLNPVRKWFYSVLALTLNPSPDHSFLVRRGTFRTTQVLSLLLPPLIFEEQGMRDYAG